MSKEETNGAGSEGGAGRGEWGEGEEGPQNKLFAFSSVTIFVCVWPCGWGFCVHLSPPLALCARQTLTRCD